MGKFKNKKRRIMKINDRKNLYSTPEVSAKLMKMETKKETLEGSSGSSESEDNLEPSVYQQLISSVKASEEAVTDSSEDEDDESDSLSDTGLTKNDNIELVDNDSAEDMKQDDDEVSGDDDDEADDQDDGENSDTKEVKSQDEFCNHFEYVIDEKIIENIRENKSWVKSNVKVPYFGKCVWISLGGKPYKVNEMKIKNLCVKQSIYNQIAVTNRKHALIDMSEKDLLSQFQRCLFTVLNDYQDFYYPGRSHKNGEEIRLVYCIHALNHVLKTRSRVTAHNSKLKSKSDDVTPDYRDQGLTRPKVLIVIPFREAAKRIVNMLQLLLMPEEESSVTHKKRFMSEYTTTEPEFLKTGSKPEDFEELFSGNIDDHFRIGIGVSKKCLKLYTDFYSADIILASPLGLRTLIGAEGDKEREFDFLSSVEVLIFDQADVFLMQNWDHILHLMNHMHIQPKEAHGVDFSRVRTWTLNGWSKYYRQTIMFSDIARPELNAIFNKHCQNWAGKLMVPKSASRGSICQIVTQLPQVFKRCEVCSFSEASDKRFEFFKSKILAEVRDKEITGKLVYISSYFDFVRLRNFLKKEEIDFVQINEYSEDKNINRARGLFFHEKVACMLYTERFHFFRRIKVRGIKNLIFYDLPSYPQFYSEICNMMKDPKKEAKTENLSCTVIYNQYDAQKLAEIVGTERAGHMITSEKPVHMFVTGET